MAALAAARLMGDFGRVLGIDLCDSVLQQVFRTSFFRLLLMHV